MYSMRAVLADINQDVRDGQPFYFSLGYVKKDGTKGEKTRVRKSGTTQPTKGSTGFKYRVKEKGILLLWDDVAGRHFSLKISLLTHYQGKLIRH